VLSAVTAAQDVAAAQSFATHLSADGFFVDLNSASPSVKQQAQAVISSGSGRYVEAVIMAPIAPKRIASPILLGGPHAHPFEALARKLGFSGVEVFSDQVGQASAAKMCRSVVIKGLEALLTESLLSARHYGVEKTVIESLHNLLPGHDWRSLARYMMSRSLLHGVRRAEEMREVALTVGESGLSPWMSSACAERQQWAAQFREHAAEESLEAMLDRLLTAAAEK
jgi:3-hydroxyisobutyrate dehydrogenase-like beta-hydroxyacid dehydrogenase